LCPRLWNNGSVARSSPDFYSVPANLSRSARCFASRLNFLAIS
jgi:hypothetical protein